MNSLKRSLSLTLLASKILISFSMITLTTWKSLAEDSLGAHQQNVHYQRLFSSCDALSCLKWKKRLVITSQKSTRQDETALRLTKNAAMLRERKVIIFLIETSNEQVRVYIPEMTNSKSNKPDSFALQPVSDKLAEEIRQRLNGLNTVLIGLDGDDKVSYDVLSLNEIFRDIDGMPMRQADK